MLTAQYNSIKVTKATRENATEMKFSQTLDSNPRREQEGAITEYE